MRPSVMSYARSRSASLLMSHCAETIVELERAKAGFEFDRLRLREFADSLRDVASPAEPRLPVRFHNVFVRVQSDPELRIDRHKDIKSVVGEVSNAFDEFNNSPDRVNDLIDFCVSLHRRLRAEVRVEDTFARATRRTRNRRAKGSVHPS